MFSNQERPINELGPFEKLRILVVEEMESEELMKMNLKKLHEKKTFRNFMEKYFYFATFIV
jgi:hypothetical protein